MAAMFGFSFTKLLVLVAIVVGVWYGFKLVGRIDEARKAEARLRERERRRAPTRGRGGAPSGGAGGEAVDAEDMVQCPACKAYVPAKGASNCGRPDCPY